jgi:hypothetical protein
VHNLSNILLVILFASFLSFPLARAENGTIFLPVADEASEVQESIQPSPNLSPVEVVRIQVEALGKNDTPHPNRGIEIAFRFASPENKRATGPLERFIQMVSSPAYRSLLNHRTAEYGPIEVIDDRAVQSVTLTAQNGEKVGYVFSLSKQAGGPHAGCWTTNGVSRFEPQEKAKEPMLSI